MGDEHRFQPLAFETLTPANVTPLGISDAVKQVGVIEARAVVIGPVETVSIRVRFDGGLPTASVGHLIQTDGELFIEGKRSVELLKVIATAAGPASVPVTTLF